MKSLRLLRHAGEERCGLQRTRLTAWLLPLRAIHSGRSTLSAAPPRSTCPTPGETLCCARREVSSGASEQQAAAPRSAPPPRRERRNGEEEEAAAPQDTEHLRLEVHREELRAALAVCYAVEKIKAQRRAATFEAATAAAASDPLAAVLLQKEPPPLDTARENGEVIYVGNKRAKFWSMIIRGSTKALADDPAESDPPPPPSPAAEAHTSPQSAATSAGRKDELGRQTGGRASRRPSPSSIEGRAGGARGKAALATSLPAPGSAQEFPQVPQPLAGARHLRRPLPNIMYRNKYKQQVAGELTAVLNRDEELGHLLLQRLSPDSRRLLLVMGTASEMFGEDYTRVAEQVHLADKDRDSAISPAEYQQWATRSVGLRHRVRSGDMHRGGSGGRGRDAGEAVAALEPEGPPPLPEPPHTPCPGGATSNGFTRSIYRRLLLTAALPFLAFGLLDNATLILAGDAVDRTMAAWFNFSSLAAAGVGGVVSGVAGIQVHGLAERWVGRVVPEPPLSPAQRGSEGYSRAYRYGSTAGMVAGLILGMAPLLFLSGGEELLEGQEEEWQLHNATVQQQSLQAERRMAKREILDMEAREFAAIQRLEAVAAAELRKEETTN